jgi:hypothetical protein
MTEYRPPPPIVVEVVVAVAVVVVLVDVEATSEEPPLPPPPQLVVAAATRSVMPSLRSFPVLVIRRGYHACRAYRRKSVIDAPTVEFP